MEATLHNPLIPTKDPVAVRKFLACRASRMTIIRVRRTLSETEIERYGIPNWGNTGVISLLRRGWMDSIAIPIPIMVALVQSIAAGLWRTRMRTQGGKVHEAGKGGSPEGCGVDNITTVYLGAEQTLGTRVSGHASNKELTRRPSASQLLKLNITFGTRPRAVP